MQIQLKVLTVRRAQMVVKIVSMGCLVFATLQARAQDAQSGLGNDASSADRQAQANESTEGLNTNRGGFFGIGGQKSLQRVGGIPLPTSRSARGGFAAAQPANPRELTPTFAARRSKPMIGELTTDFPARMIYLNGRNISSVREQELEGVNVRIDSNGNVHISAPHYEVQESSHYRPLLPHEVPKVGKPSLQTDRPLFSGGNSKMQRLPNSVGAVPPVESDEAAQAPVNSSARGADDVGNGSGAKLPAKDNKEAKETKESPASAAPTSSPSRSGSL